MFITGHDFDGDGANDLYVVHSPMSAADSAALVKFAFWTFVIVLLLAGLAWVGLGLLNATNWVVNQLSQWTRWDWLFWLSFPLIGFPSVVAFAKTHHLGATLATLVATSFPFALLAALWSWSVTGWIIFSGIILGIFTLLVGAILIIQDRRKYIIASESSKLPQEPLHEGYVQLRCPTCQQKLKIPSSKIKQLLTCRSCFSRFKVRRKQHIEC